MKRLSDIIKNAKKRNKSFLNKTSKLYKELKSDPKFSSNLINFISLVSLFVSISLTCISGGYLLKSVKWDYVLSNRNNPQRETQYYIAGVDLNGRAFESQKVSKGLSHYIFSYMDNHPEFQRMYLISENTTTFKYNGITKKSVINDTLEVCKKQ